jgi:hypothetical protein
VRSQRFGPIAINTRGDGHDGPGPQVRTAVERATAAQSFAYLARDDARNWLGARQGCLMH